MELLGIAADEKDWMLHQVSGILHLGNVSFESDGDTGSKVCHILLDVKKS